MSVCTTCLQHGLPADGQHDCPGLGEITVTRQLGHGLIVTAAPRRARMALTLLTNSAHGLTMASNDQINIADQVLYQVVAYDPETAALVLELVEDWRPASGVLTFDRRLTEAEMEETRSRWRETYGKPGTAHPVVELHEEQP